LKFDLILVGDAVVPVTAQTFPLILLPASLHSYGRVGYAP